MYGNLTTRGFNYQRFKQIDLTSGHCSRHLFDTDLSRYQMGYNIPVSEFRSRRKVPKLQKTEKPGSNTGENQQIRASVSEQLYPCRDITAL